MTKILRVDPINFCVKDLRDAIAAINLGGLVAFPTETVYGLGANALNPEAVKKIFLVKRRPMDNPIIVHIAKIDDLYKLARRVPDWVEKAIKTLWPGPITFVLEKKDIVPYEVTGGLDTVAIRMPAHPVALELIRNSKPIAAPSANISGKPSPTTAEDVIDDLFGKVDIIIDAGETFFGVESTVIDATEDVPIVLRPGPMTVEELEKVLGIKIEIHPSAFAKKFSGSPKSPGMKYRHYAPNAKLILVEGDYEKVLEEIYRLYTEMKSRNVRVALMLTRESLEKLGVREDVIILGERNNLYTVAKNLFKSLRLLDKMGYEIGVCESFELKGIGLAIMNRLRKASTQIINI